jgi:hypothetical protein
MSSLADLDEKRLKADFVALVNDGADEKTAYAKAVEKQTRRQPSAGESFAAGLTQLPFIDEIMGVLNALYPVPGTDQGGVVENYRSMRDAGNAEADDARAAHPIPYEAGRLTNAIATAPLMPQVGATKIASGVGRAIVNGAIQGGVMGLDDSRAKTLGGMAADTATGAAIGGAAGGALTSAGKAAVGGARAVDQAVVSRIPGAIGKAARGRSVARVAEKAAKDVAKNAAEPSLIGVGQTVDQSTAAADAAEKRWSATIGERVQLRPSQKTGDPEAALGELRARNFPATMRRAQAQEQKLLQQSSRILDEQVKSIAADPARLGRKEVGDGLLKTIEQHGDNLEAARSAVGREMYDAARAAGGGVEFAPIRDAFNEVMKRSELDPTKTVPQLKTILGRLENKGAGGGLALSEVQDLRSYLGRVARGKANMLSEAPQKQQADIARHLLGVIDKTLDDAAETAGSADGVRLFREANRVWREHTQNIEATATDTIKQILGVSADATDTITKRLNKASADQIGGVFRLLNKADPAQAQQLRAQMLDDWLVTVGKKAPVNSRVAGDAASSVSEDIGASELRPGSLFASFHEMAPRLLAAFEGDNKAKMALVETGELVKRLSFGPNIRGSTTAPTAADALKETFGSGAEVAAGMMLGPAAAKGVAATVGFFSKLSGNAQAAADALTTRDGIQAFNGALRLALDERAGRVVPPERARAAIAALTRAGIDSVNEKEQRP